MINIADEAREIDLLRNDMSRLRLVEKETRVIPVWRSAFGTEPVMGRAFQRLIRSTQHIGGDL